MLDTMFDLPSLANVRKVVIDENTIVHAEQSPLLIYSDQPKVAGTGA
jgi:ATP-dependent protease Clp ATPase subunit